MTKTHKRIPRGPGRPRKPGAPTAAQRMQASRARKRKPGLRLVQTWVSDAPVTYSDHMRLDARSLALHAAVARKLLESPSIIDQARSTLERWKEQHGPDLPSYFEEWDRLLKRRPEEVAGLIVSMTEDATRLRQSSPFVNFLTPRERSKIFEAFA